MGNKQSDQGETAAFNVIKCIPLFGQIYGLGRMAVYGGRGDTNRVAASFTGAFVAPIAPGAADHLERIMIEDNAGAWKTAHEMRYGCHGPSPGDLIEFDCTSFGHYALYLGDGKVMNVRARGPKDTTALIKEETIEEVCTWLETNSVRIRRIHDQVAEDHFGASPKSQDSILASARRMQGKRVQYQFTLRNCEYYVTLWRYGYGFSTQVARPTTTPFGALVPGFSGVLSSSLVIAEANVYKRYKEISVEDNN